MMTSFRIFCSIISSSSLPSQTHKMNPNYRGQRFDRNAVSLIVRKRVVMEKEITAAIEDLSKLGIIQK